MRVLAFASELLSLEIVGNLSLFLLFRFCFWFSLNRFLFDSNFYTMKFSMFSAFPSPAFTLPSRPRPLPGELFYCIACLSVCQALFLPFFIFSALRLLPSDSSVILSNLLPLVNLFTYLFLIFFPLFFLTPVQTEYKVKNDPAKIEKTKEHINSRRACIIQYESSDQLAAYGAQIAPDYIIS